MNAVDPPTSSAQAGGSGTADLGDLLADLPFSDTDAAVVSASGRLALGELRARVAALAATLREARVCPGHPVGTLVAPGPSSIVAMFATWAVGAVYVPINHRFTSAEVSSFLAETPVALVVGAPDDLEAHSVDVGIAAHDYPNAQSWVGLQAEPGAPRYEPDIALVLRTSGTTGRPKAVLLRHSGTVDALDASLEKLRRSGRGRKAAGSRPPRMNLIPLSLALWAGVFNALFSFRAGFGIVLLDRFTPAGFARAVREYGITSTVLAPAMIAMLADAADVGDLSPLRLVRSITAPLSPEVARQFHRRYGVFVLNSYGQTELGGEVVGWTTEDLRAFGESKLGAAGRAYDHVDLRIRMEDGSEAAIGELGEVYVRSPFRMRGYALAGQLPRRDRRGPIRQRLPPYGRHRPSGRGRLLVGAGTRQRHDQPRRPQGLSRRGGGDAASASRGPGCRRRRPTRSSARRGAPCLDRGAGQRRYRGADRVVPQSPRAVQGADRLHPSPAPAALRHRQAAPA